MMSQRHSRTRIYRTLESWEVRVWGEKTAYIHLLKINSRQKWRTSVPQPLACLMKHVYWVNTLIWSSEQMIENFKCTRSSCVAAALILGEQKHLNCNCIQSSPPRNNYNYMGLHNFQQFTSYCWNCLRCLMYKWIEINECIGRTQDYYYNI